MWDTKSPGLARYQGFIRAETCRVAEGSEVEGEGLSWVQYLITSEKLNFRSRRKESTDITSCQRAPRCKWCKLVKTDQKTSSFTKTP